MSVATMFGCSDPSTRQATTPPTGPDMTVLALSGPGSLRIGSELTLSGTLTFDGNPAPAGTVVTVTRSWSGSSDTTTFPVTTAADGTFQLGAAPSPGCPLLFSPVVTACRLPFNQRPA